MQTLSGTVRITAKGPFEGQVGVITDVLWGNDQSALYVDFPLIYVRIGNDKPVAFEQRELERIPSTTEQSK